MLFYLLLFVGLFGFVLFKGLEEKRQKESPIIFAAIVYTFVCSVIALCIYVFLPTYDRFLFFMVGVTLGGLIIIIAINNLSAIFRCRMEVRGVYCGYRTYSGGKGQHSYAPVFKYTYEGKKYFEQSAQSVAFKLLDQVMTEGEVYTIYVDDQHPNQFVLKKKVQVMDVMMLLFGVLCLLVAFWALL